MATVKTIIEKAYTKVNGEFEALTESSDDFKTYLNVLNQCIEGLVHTPYVKWQIFFDMDYTLPDPIVDGTLSYDIPDFTSITLGNSPFDNIYFVDGTGTVVDKYKVVDVAMFQSTDNKRVCAVASGKLWLKETNEKIVGTTIRIPAYVDPASYTGADEEVIIDSVPWLVAEMSAFICDASPVPFIARNADKYYKQSAIFMKEMRDTNRKTQVLMVKKLDAQVGHTWADVLNVMTIQDL